MTAETERKRFFSQSNKEGLRNPWVLGWLTLLVVVVGVNVGMVTTAFVTNPGLVDENYYESGQAVEQAYLKRMEARNALGWDVALEVPAKAVAGKPGVFRLTVRDKAGRAVEHAQVRMTAYRPSDASADFSVDLKESARGQYDAYLALPLKGIWDLKLHVVRDGDRWDFSRRVSAAAS